MTSLIYILISIIGLFICSISIMFFTINKKIDNLTKNILKLIDTFEGINQDNIKLININCELITKFSNNISFIKQYMIRRKIPNTD